MEKTILEELKSALEKEHNLLVSELKQIAKPDPAMKGNWDAKFPAMGASQSDSHASTDELADEIEEYEVWLEAEHTLESRLLRVNQALEHIKRGTYGFCKKCKKEIPIERLRANPAAEFDMEHTI